MVPAGKNAFRLQPMSDGHDRARTHSRTAA
jgi:hypothetical protein